MNMSLGELWAKLQNYVDPILAGIITLAVLNLAGLGLAYYVFDLPPIEHPLQAVHAAERTPYEPVFTEQVKATKLSDTATNLAAFNFFKPGVGVRITERIVDRPDSPEVRQDTPVQVANQITKVTYLGGVFTGGAGVAQLTSEEARDATTVFMVRVGNTIPGTDIRLKQIDRYYVVLSRPGFKDTQVPVRGAISVAPGQPTPATPSRPSSRPSSRRRSAR